MSGNLAFLKTGDIFFFSARLCHSASAAAVCFALFLTISLFPHSLSLAAAQQPLALQIQPLISDLGGCLGEEGYWLRVCGFASACVKRVCVKLSM